MNLVLCLALSNWNFITPDLILKQQLQIERHRGRGKKNPKLQSRAFRLKYIFVAQIIAESKDV